MLSAHVSLFRTAPGAPVDAAVVAQLRAAAAAGRATRCIYEAGNSACQAPLDVP